MSKLENGKKYVNRIGKMVTVYSSDQFSYPFYSEDDSGYVVTYRSDGLYLGSSDQDDRDLVAEYMPSSDNISGYVSKEKLAEYIKNKLAVLETLSDSSNEKVSFAATMQMQELILLADEFEIV